MDKRIIFFGVVVLCMMFLLAFRKKARSIKMEKEKKVLFVVTSHDKKGSTGKPTGFYLSEVSHVWDVLVNAGYEIDFVSPKGGKAPVDGFDLKDPINAKFWNDPKYHQKIENTMRPEDVNPLDYSAIFYAGGHGTMWDFPNNTKLAKIAAQIYDANGAVGAVCHGPAGLVNIKLSNGQYLVKGKTVAAFTNSEEQATGLSNVVPFLLETKLVERGAIHKKSKNWANHVEVSARLVTGQNPASAKDVGLALLKVMESN